MENKLYFNAREWYALAEECKQQVSSRTFMTGMDGKLVEVYMLGDWTWHWSEISSRPMRLEKNTEYTFTFWLNGGENDNCNETCQFVILHSNQEHESYDRSKEYVYKLNRNFIKPIKKRDGWELYSIPFVTEDKEFTRLKFIALAAPMAVMPAKDVSDYTELEERLVEFEDERPQRHNIVFSDGFPPNTWYATKNLRKGTIHNNVINNDDRSREDLYDDLIDAITMKIREVDVTDSDTNIVVLQTLNQMLEQAYEIAEMD